MKRYWGAIVMVLLTTNAVFGQLVGDRVRITVLDNEVIGTVAEKSGQAFKIQLNSGQLHSVEFTEIRKLERSLGKRGNAGKGFLIGGVSGVLIGVIAISGAEEGDDFMSNVGFISDEVGSVLAVTALGVGGSLVGLLAGSLTKTEKWKAVGIPSGRAKLNLNRRIFLGARVQF